MANREENLTALFVAHGKSDDVTRAAIYMRALERLTDEELAVACEEGIRSSRWLPSVEELIEAACGKSLTIQDRARLAFESAVAAVASCGAYESPDFADTAINAAIRMIGGWTHFAGLDSDVLRSHGRNAFLQAYETATKLSPSDPRRHHLVGIHEANALREQRRLPSVKRIQCIDSLPIACKTRQIRAIEKERISPTFIDERDEE